MERFNRSLPAPTYNILTFLLCQVMCSSPASIELSPLIHGPTGLPPCPATARAGRVASQAYRYSTYSTVRYKWLLSFKDLLACPAKVWPRPDIYPVKPIRTVPLGTNHFLSFTGQLPAQLWYGPGQINRLSSQAYKYLLTHHFNDLHTYLLACLSILAQIFIFLFNYYILFSVVFFPLRKYSFSY